MAAPARRKSAEERREDILAVAMQRFSQTGFHGTSTDDIATDAGLSQPYLFRLFGTKKALFLACNERACDRVLDVFRRTAENATTEKLEALGQAYVYELLPDRHAVLMMMQGFAASSDPEIQERVRGKYGEIIDEVGRLTGATPDEVWRFFASGMLLNIVAALDLPVIAPDNPIVAAWAEMH